MEAIRKSCIYCKFHSWVGSGLLLCSNSWAPFVKDKPQRSKVRKIQWPPRPKVSNLAYPTGYKLTEVNSDECGNFIPKEY